VYIWNQYDSSEIHFWLGTSIYCNKRDTEPGKE
jgi:hypothetical protein